MASVNKVSDRIHRLTAPARLLAAILMVCAVVAAAGAPAVAAQLVPRSVRLSSAAPGDRATYQVTLGGFTPGLLGSLSIQFCANNPFVGAPCQAPSGMDTSSVVLTQQSGSTGFVVSPATGSNTVILTRPPSPASAGISVYSLDNILNPSSVGPYYVRIATYAASNATGSPTDTGGMAFAINNAVGVSADVPPYLMFCLGGSIAGTDCLSASGDYVNFGDLSASRTAIGQTQMVAATNAQSGYSIFVSGTTMTSGNDIIAPLSSAAPAQAGTAQFGLNLTANVSPLVGDSPSGPGNAMPVSAYGQANLFRFRPGDVVAASAGPDEPRKFTVSYIVDIPSGQPGGVYASTLTYVCLANF